MLHSTGGGTGSGVGSELLEHFGNEYNKKAKINFSVFNSPKLSNSVVEPYNSVLLSYWLLEHSDCTIMFDNQALYSLS